VDDIMETLVTFYMLPMVDFIGIPRVITKMLGSRLPTLMAMQQSPAFIGRHGRSFSGFHLLGFSDDILDDVCCARVPWIQGIDSNVPVRAGKKGIKVSLDDLDPRNGWSARTGPRGNFWEDELFENDLSMTRHNLNTYRNWISL
jgi:hypothetical protein